jgi:hypothetical protein
MTFTILSRYREVAAIGRKAAIKRRSDPQFRALLWQIIVVSRPAFPGNPRAQDALRLSATVRSRDIRTGIAACFSNVRVTPPTHMLSSAWQLHG